MRKNVDEVDVIIHENTKKHIVVIAAKLGKAIDVWANINALRADKNLSGKSEGVEEVLVGILNAFAFGFRHKIEVDGFTGDYGAERAIFHNNHRIAKL